MLTLSDLDQAMLDGRHGPAAQFAMQILVRMADVYQARELMDISHAHIDSAIYLGDATLEFAERLASLGARVAVPTSRRPTQQSTQIGGSSLPPRRTSRQRLRSALGRSVLDTPERLLPERPQRVVVARPL